MDRLPQGDLFTWVVALVAGALGTLVGLGAGARLGVALTLGVVLMLGVVLARLAIEATSGTKSRS